MDEYESLIIEVTGISNKTSKDTLENYFSSSRRGGDIANVEYIKGSGNASITFTNAEGAKKALETRPHSLEESTLTTRRKKAEISENDKVFVEGIPTKPSENDTEGISDLDVNDITHDTKSSDNLNAIVTFYSPVDFHKIKEGFKKKPTLEGKDISVKTVPLCKTILVKNIPTTATDDSVLYRFENKRSGGGEVEDSGVHLDPEKGIALVEFKDPNVIDKVLSVKQTWGNTTLSVERYYPILGSIEDLKLTEQETTRREVPTVMPGQHEDVIEIAPVHLKLLESSTRFQRLENSLKGDGCEIHLDETKGGITVKGSQAQIQNLKVETQDIVDGIDEHSLNQSKFSLLKTNEGLSYVKSLLSNENLNVEVLFNNQGNVMLHGMDKTQVQQAYDTVDNAIGEMKLPPSLGTKSSQDALLNELGASILLTLQTDEGQPRIICFKKHLADLSGKIDDFLEREKTVKVRVPLGKLALRYLTLHGEYLFDGLLLSSPGLEIVIDSDALDVSGEKPLVDNCCTSIQQFIRGLTFSSMNYGAPETSTKEEAAMAIVQNIERKHQCAIVIITKEENDICSSFNAPPTSPVDNLNENRKRTLQCRYTYPSGKIIEIHEGDILNHPVYYLVNSANDEMKHSAGLAKAIQKDSSRVLHDQGRDKLLPGEVVTTDGGSFMCEKILHVVMPKFRPTLGGHEGDTREAMFLRHCCTNVLKNATDGQTIAVPALGSGIYAKSLVTAAYEFLQENPSHALREVHFVDNDPTAIEALMKEMTTRFKYDLNFQINELVRDRWRPYLGAASVTPPSAPVVYSGDMEFETPEGMEIRLTVGNIAKSTTDVIVNIVASDLNLTKNPCSKAILEEAGSKITTFCEKWIKVHGEVQEGNFAVTDGAQLICKKVLHVSCPSWTADHGEKILRQLVQKLLAKVQTLFLTSISIPALGTGMLKFPDELVAKVLFEEAMKFSSKHSSSLKIKQYNVVVYSGNTNEEDIFKQQFQVYSETKKDTNVRRTKRRMFGLLTSAVKEKAKSSEDETHGVNVEIVQGNIVQESTDAIGFLVREDIAEGGQTGAILLRGAGVRLSQEYTNLGEIEDGYVVTTSAGNLRASYLLHMVVKVPSWTMIQSAVTNCLNHAEFCGFTSLAVPAVGTGKLRGSVKLSAEILHSCIEEYRKRKEKSLKLIRIVILHEDVFADFKKAFALAQEATTSTDFKAGTRRTRQQITLEIAAESSNNVNMIKEKLTQVEQSHLKTIKLWQKFDERQLAEILEVQDLHCVRIECEPVIGFIRISGLAKNVPNALREIHRIIHDLDATVREVQWFYYETNANFVIPEKYADSMSAKIERAYKNDPSGSVVVGEEMKVEIDFKTMTERCLDPTENEKMKVYRRPCEAFPFPFPPNWEFQPIDCSTGKKLEVHRFTIHQQSQEFDQIHGMFKASMSMSMALANAEIVKIEKIQNPGLHQIYEEQKKKMSNGGNEMRLFHGTAKIAVENINTTGFNRANCEKNAVKFGKGVYFAKQAWYSVRNIYSVPDEKGLQYMYIARVLVGKYTKGKEGLIMPPPIDAENNQIVRYDSVVDNVINPLMFVIFFDYQSYPEYLITFKNP